MHPFLGQIPIRGMGQVITPVPSQDAPPGTIPFAPAVRADLPNTLFAAGALVALGAAAYAIFT